MAEYLYNELQTVQLNNPAIFDNSIPCNKGYIYHQTDTGIFILRGVTPNCFARYQIIFNGNIALPEGAEVVPISIGIAENGEIRPTSIATVTPAAAQNYFNVTSTAIIDIPKGCCFTISVRATTPEVDTTITPANSIELRNANLTINRTA